MLLAGIECSVTDGKHGLLVHVGLMILIPLQVFDEQWHEAGGEHGQALSQAACGEVGHDTASS